MPSSSTRYRVLLCTFVALVLTVAAPPCVRALHETTTPESRSPRADTLRFEGTPGEYLIVQLPRQIGERKVLQYEPVRLPALSLLVDHAFFWATRDDDAGRYVLQLRARYDDAPSETVTMIVELSYDDE